MDLRRALPTVRRKKIVYEFSLATDSDTGEEMVIWIAYPLRISPDTTPPAKTFVEMDGERKAKYTRLLNVKISNRI